MKPSNTESTFRRRARKVTGVYLLINAIFALLTIIALIAFVVWIQSQT